MLSGAQLRQKDQSHLGREARERVHRAEAQGAVIQSVSELIECDSVAVKTVQIGQKRGDLEAVGLLKRNLNRVVLQGNILQVRRCA